MELNYRPVAERTVDEQYKRLIREVMEKGIRGPGVMVGTDGKEVDTIDLMGPTPARFNILENGVPLITEREIKSVSYTHLTLPTTSRV